MRRVIIQGTPPQGWIDDADAVTVRLRGATSEAERAAIIEEKEELWRDGRIRDWLLQQFKNKCWYTEAYDSVSAIHVDHYRPKGRVKDLEGNTCEGYWWLAFNWENYRICGQLINVKKHDVFPLTEGLRADPAGQLSLELEAPVLIDPLTEQTRLITYQKDEDTCMAVPASDVNENEALRAEKTIELLGLNLRDRLNKKRADFWDRCLMAIEDYRNAAGPQPLQLVMQASAKAKLRQMIDYEAEFSSVAEACIRKHAPAPLIASVFEQAIAS